MSKGKKSKDEDMQQAATETLDGDKRTDNDRRQGERRTPEDRREEDRRVDERRTIMTAGIIQSLPEVDRRGVHDRRIFARRRGSRRVSDERREGDRRFLDDSHEA